MEGYIYIVCLLLMFIVLYLGVTQVFSYAPIKIKSICIITFLLVLLRYSTLLIFLLFDNIRHVYILKHLTFLNIIYIPLLIFISFYIGYRNSKMNIGYFYYIFYIAIIFYGISIFKIPIQTYISPVYGYNLIMLSILPYIVLITINVFMFIVLVKVYKYPYCIKVSILYQCLSSIFMVITICIALMNVEFMGIIIIAELMWMATLNYNLKRFKGK